MATRGTRVGTIPPRRPRTEYVPDVGPPEDGGHYLSHPMISCVCGRTYQGRDPRLGGPGYDQCPECGARAYQDDLGIYA